MSDWLDAENHVERAHELYEAGRWAEAERELREALSRDPNQPEWLFNLGLTLDAGGRHADAADAFRESFQAGPGDPHAALMVGVSLLRAGEPTRAVEWLERAEQIDPRNLGSFVHRIEAYARLGRHDQAELMFYMAEQIDPRSPDALVALADSLLERGLFDKAVWCLREAASCDADYPGVQGRLAHAYAGAGRHERARQLYLRELRRSPGDVRVLLSLGCLLVEMNRYVEAGDKFRRVLELEPDQPDAHFLLGDLALREGRPLAARTHLDVVLRLEPRYPGARRRLARLLQTPGAAHDPGRAADLLRRELADLRAQPDLLDPDALADLGGLLLDAGMPIEAVPVFRDLAVRRPADAQSRHVLSVALFESGNLPAGMASARRALRADPRHVPAMHNLALAHLRLGQWRRARTLVRQALRVAPDDASLRRLLLRLRLASVAAAAMTFVRFWLRRRAPE
jgi:tetratricopeptide (TPR) repeat protein